jgi:hypothetical protein
MIAITLNLLAEEQQAQVERARDPIKLFIVIGLSVLTVAVAWGGILSAILSQRRVELLGLEARWKKMNDVGQGEGDYQKENDFAAQLVAVNHSRVVVAPQVAMVKDLIPPSVQLTHISFALAEETTGGDGGGEESAEGKRHARPKQSTHLVLQLEGTASNVQPELEVDRFLKSLRSDTRFGPLVEDIQLRSIARATSDADKASAAVVPAVNFTIECWYKEQVKK